MNLELGVAEQRLKQSPPCACDAREPSSQPRPSRTEAWQVAAALDQLCLRAGGQVCRCGTRLLLWEFRKPQEHNWSLPVVSPEGKALCRSYQQPDLRREQGAEKWLWV